MNLSLMKKLYQNDAGKFSLGTLGGSLLNAGFVVSDYSDARSEGDGVGSAALKAGGSLALMQMMGTKAFLGLSLLSAAPGVAVDAYDAASMYGRNLSRMGRNKPFANSTFVDTQQTYTMRQAGMNLAKQSKYAMQQARLGDEARAVNM
jgi:hypothetical protein